MTLQRYQVTQVVPCFVVVGFGRVVHAHLRLDLSAVAAPWSVQHHHHVLIYGAVTQAHVQCLHQLHVGVLHKPGANCNTSCMEPTWISMA